MKDDEGAQDPPEGKFLLQIGLRAMVEESRAEAITVATGVVSYDLSPDGDFIVATTPRAFPDGTTRGVSLVLIEVATGRRTVLANARPGQSFGPAAWSPDGTRIAYRFGSVRTDFPTATELSVCVVLVGTGEERCFQDAGIGPVNWFDWSPDGSQLVVAGFGGDPVRRVNVQTGEHSVLIPPHGNESIRQGLRNAGLRGPGSLAQPEWSPTGTYVALSVFAPQGGEVPLIVDREGAFVALGRPNPDWLSVEWSTTQDVLAYTTGPGVTEFHPDMDSGVRLLDPVTGEDRWLLDTTGQKESYIISPVWSPDGRWLALGTENFIRIVDVTGTEPSSVMEIETSDVPDSLRDWSV